MEMNDFLFLIVVEIFGRQTELHRTKQPGHDRPEKVREQLTPRARSHLPPNSGKFRFFCASGHVALLCGDCWRVGMRGARAETAADWLNAAS